MTLITWLISQLVKCTFNETQNTNIYIY